MKLTSKPRAVLPSYSDAPAVELHANAASNVQASLASRRKRISRGKWGGPAAAADEAALPRGPAGILYHPWPSGMTKLRRSRDPRCFVTAPASYSVINCFLPKRLRFVRHAGVPRVRCKMFGFCAASLATTSETRDVFGSSNAQNEPAFRRILCAKRSLFRTSWSTSPLTTNALHLPNCQTANARLQRSCSVAHRRTDFSNDFWPPGGTWRLAF